MLPRLGTSPLVTNWIVLTIAVSVVGALDGRFAAWCALIPSRVVQGEVWRLFTWPFVQTGPLSLVLSCAAIYKFGGELAVRWGDRRLQRFMLEVLLAAGAITCVLALAANSRFMIRLGGWAASEALVIAWARQFPTRPLVLYGMLVLRGQALVNLTVGTALLFAIYFGPVLSAPELAACLIAALYPTGLLRR